MAYQADIGVIGGSGFYALLSDVEEVDIQTPYGSPSDKIALGTYEGKHVAFLPRHGKAHTLPPHKLPYQANLYAFKQLGVKFVIGPTASGSLQAHIKPGDFVVSDQFVDRTKGRQDTYFDGPEVIHPSSANPYCAYLRGVALACGRKLNLPMHDGGTVVVIQGPRFSTVSESRWFTQMGWATINMTQYPECYLAHELGMCYANISLVTDYDAGLEGRDDIAPVSHEEVLEVFAANNDKLKALLFEMIKAIDLGGGACHCAQL